MNKWQAKERIAELTTKLAQTDYQAIKFAEGEMTMLEYNVIKAQRQQWRAEINQIEQQINE